MYYTILTNVFNRKMKHKEIHKSIEVKTHAEKVLKAELDAILITLNAKAFEGTPDEDSIKSSTSMRSAAKNLEDSLHLLLTHRKYLENPEEYKLT